MEKDAVDDDDEPATFSSPIPSFRFRWDVFLSFRGEDTRHGFTERLYNELVRNGIRAFRDDEELERGEEIAPSLVTAIEDSAASIAVISENYASSRWCLEELAKILERRRMVMLPVFYKVDPSDVRRQKGPFEKAFWELEERFGVDMVVRWRKAMEKAGNISGWDSRIWDEKELIQSLVKKVLSHLSNTPLGVAKYPVGLNSRLEELMRMFDVKVNDVRVLGFYGMGGVGKTTLAKALYNKLVIHFKRRTFHLNVRETSREHNGLISLQNKLIDDLSSRAAPHVNEVSRGIISIKGLISEEPVLVLLDDVDDVSQLHALACKKEWFYEGSRIIITTRDKNVLDESIPNELIHEVKELSTPMSLQLFSYHAFGKEKPPIDFMGLSEKIVSLTGRLPLALEVFGSSLFYERRIEGWEERLRKLQRIRTRRLHDVLEISFNELDEEVKCIFLDIACFFVKMRMKREDAIDIFKGCGFNAETAITALTAKSLIKIIEGNIFWVHDQLRDMGRQIVLRVNDPGMRSRLWDPDEIMSVLKNKKGTRHIQGIALEFEKKNELSSEKISWLNFISRPSIKSATMYLKEKYKKCFRHGVENQQDMMLHTNSFKPMVNLRLLEIDHVTLDGSFKFMPAELKWLQWKGCQLRTLPSEFCFPHLGVLDLSESKITQLLKPTSWKWNTRNKMCEKLLVMNLRDCYSLTEIPDLSGHRLLEKLILERCKGLSMIHESVGHLSTLLYLNLKDCSNLVEFPSDITGLKHLETLILSGCSKLQELPEDVRSMRSLRELLLDRTAVTKLPDSIFRLKKLENLSLKDCWSLKQLPGCIGELSSLKQLSLDGSGLKEIPDTIGSLTDLETLSLVSCRSLTALPDSISNLKSLTELFLGSSSVKELPASIGSLSHLKILSADRCRFLSKLPDSIEGLVSLLRLHLGGTSITEVPCQVGSLNMLESLEMGYCELLISLPQSLGKMLSLSALVLNNVSITELPESIGMLERLNMLKLNQCKQLQQLPASIGNLKCLRSLLMAETSVRDLPEEFGLLSSLTVLKMGKNPHEQTQNAREHTEPWTQQNFKPALPVSFSRLSSLKELDVCAWKITGKIPDDFENLKSLEKLNLGHNNFCSLPSSLRGLSALKELVLNDCKDLRALPQLPSSLLKLNVANCTALESVGDMTDLESLEELCLTNCNKLMEISGFQCLKSLKRLFMSNCKACFQAVKGRFAKVDLRRLRSLSVPGSEIPNWFVQEIPKFSSPKNRVITGILIGVVVSLDQENPDPFRNKLPGIVDIQAKILGHNDQTHTTTLDLRGVPETDEDQLYLSRYPAYSKLVLMLKEGDKIQMGIRNTPYFHGLRLKKYGIHVFFENDDDYDDDEKWLDESQQSVSEKLTNFIASL